MRRHTTAETLSAGGQRYKGQSDVRGQSLGPTRFSSGAAGAGSAGAGAGAAAAGVVPFCFWSSEAFVSACVSGFSSTTAGAFSGSGSGLAAAASPSSSSSSSSSSSPGIAGSELEVRDGYATTCLL